MIEFILRVSKYHSSNEEERKRKMRTINESENVAIHFHYFLLRLRSLPIVWSFANTICIGDEKWELLHTTTTTTTFQSKSIRNLYCIKCRLLMPFSFNPILNFSLISFFTLPFLFWRGGSLSFLPGTPISFANFHLHYLTSLFSLFSYFIYLTKYTLRYSGSLRDIIT